MRHFHHNVTVEELLAGHTYIDLAKYCLPNITSFRLRHILQYSFSHDHSCHLIVTTMLLSHNHHFISLWPPCSCLTITASSHPHLYSLSLYHLKLTLIYQSSFDIGVILSNLHPIIKRWLCFATTIFSRYNPV